ncbi:Wadjet anti-phage system protein JetD domain-containing protein [Clostridium sp. C105KSO13]|uniref:Wadjet anti-phage system protein JetD domain-containing protein n=1 Tax=Clostridium sp. C105KSO13 TaxID=1776045 RepID=UPI000740689E|nr:Wadjet anti-phage system protein JetD domain-containing protein [Clostridium sp. C105KSO13]CUX32415.1 hypothetical protein BN3456_01400 [Clostridium sp. C105KSO13]
MKRISLEKLLLHQQNLSYNEQYSYIMELISTGKIKPLKAAGTNGKKPALFRGYWVLEKKKDYGELEDELKYRLLPVISVDYYLSHPDVYERDRPWVLMLNDYLKNWKEKLKVQESANERSFEIWRREKFLTREQGRHILNRCGLDLQVLNIYGTTEPLAYYSHTRSTPQNLLILENKDTFYSMRRHLLEGSNSILDTPIGTLIYGAGKGILRSFRDFDLCVEPYMKENQNKIYYFGDLDYEGIGIYESLAEMFHDRWEIIPFVSAYRAMLEKSAAAKKEDSMKQLPDTKERQNRNIQNKFFPYFSTEEVEKMKKILEQGKYIPQEILNITDF